MNAIIAVHMIFALPALVLGGFILSRAKGTPRHKLMGRYWAGLMVVTALSSFWIFGNRDSLGPVHVLSALTLVSIVAAIVAIRGGNVRLHKNCMLGALIGLVVAAAGTLAPGRLIGGFFFGG